MANLDSIVNVSISLNTASVQRGVFGIQLIAAPLASFPEVVRTYTDYDDSNPDNLPPDVLKAVQTAFSQTPHPAQVKVGRLSIAKAVIEPADAVAGATYGVTIGTTAVNVVAAASPTAATIATQLATAINTAALGVTATAVTGTVELTYPGAPVGVTGLTRMTWGATTPSAAVGVLASDLSAIIAADNTWYVLNMVERTKQRVLDAAAWIETQDTLFVTASSEAGILVQGTTTDVGSLLKPYFRTAWLYHGAAATEYADAAWTARVLPIQPGSDTWALKRLAAVTADNLSPTQALVVLGKGGNTLEPYSNDFSLTRPGKVAAGEWIDTIRGRDWLRNYMQTSLTQMMVNRDKIPYTDGGLQLLAANVRASLREAQRVGLIAPDGVDEDNKSVPGFSIMVPKASDVDAATKASRIAYLNFTGRIAGAIHAAVITGALAYELS
jgi:hypothetical protein